MIKSLKIFCMKNLNQNFYYKREKSANGKHIFEIYEKEVKPNYSLNIELNEKDSSDISELLKKLCILKDCLSNSYIIEQYINEGS